MEPSFIHPSTTRLIFTPAVVLIRPSIGALISNNSDQPVSRSENFVVACSSSDVRCLWPKTKVTRGNEIQTKTPREMVQFDVDLLIREIGPFGKYQLINYLLLCFAIGWTTMYTLTYVFTAGDVSYRCQIPACDANRSMLDPTTSAYLNFTVPMQDNGKWSQCTQFRYLENSDTEPCRPENFDRNVVEDCEEFVYQSDEETIQNTFGLTCDKEWKLSLLGTINNIGHFVCLPLTGFLSDLYGRKFVFVGGIISAGVLGTIRGYSVGYEMFAVFEFLEPALGSAVYSSGFILGETFRVFLYFSSMAFIIYFSAMEYVDPSKRVMGTSFINVFYTVGMALLGVFAYLTKNWRILLWTLYTPSALILAYYWILPESTRWLATKGQINKAKKNIIKAGEVNKTKFSEAALKMLRSDHEEFLELKPKEEVNSEETEKAEEPKGYPILKALKNRTMIIRLVIMSICWVANTFVYYGLSIYSVSFVGDKYINYIASSLIELPGVFITYFLVDWKFLGRKGTLMSMLLLSAVACFCQLAMDTSNQDDSVISPGPFTLFLIGKCAITVSLIINSFIKETS